MTRLAESRPISPPWASCSTSSAPCARLPACACRRRIARFRTSGGMRRRWRQAIGAALLLLPEGSAGSRTATGRRALILCTAEHGFVGGFNERILDAARSVLDPEDALFILGSRGAALAQERGRPAAWAHPMATRPEGVPETIRHLTAELYRLDRPRRGRPRRSDLCAPPAGRPARRSSSAFCSRLI